MNKNIIWIGIVIVVVLGVGMWALLMNSPASAPESSENQGVSALPVDLNPPKENSPADNTVTPSSSEANSAVSKKEFTVTGKNFSFTPNALTVKRGDSVKITFKNAGGTHDFKIDEFAVATKRIGTGEQESIEFIADKTGSFEYYCSVGSHRTMGMKGTLTVTE